MLENPSGPRPPVATSREQSEAAPDRKSSMASLPEGFSLLIVEGNVILALDVEDMLLRRGAARVDVVGSCQEALQVLKSAEYHAAVLDLNLPRGNILSVAARLAELKVPFAFSASYGERTHLPEPYATAVVINTPCNEVYLMSALVRLMDQTSQA